MCETGGKFVKVGGKRIIFAKTGGKYTETWKIENGEKIRNLWSITKKRSSEISADENQEIFGKIVKIFLRV